MSDPRSLSTHVLDSSIGKPAGGVSVRWERRVGEGWQDVAHAVTDDDGRVADWETERALVVGTHRLVFGSGDYFSARGVTTFYPEVVIMFEVVDEAAHHHVPLLLSPFAYSTYRGS